MGRVLVAGSINMDVVVTTQRHPKIGETVSGEKLFFYPGGKGANQAVAASKLSAQTIMIGKVGVDAFGKELVAFLSTHRIDTNNISASGKEKTGVAVIIVAEKDNVIVVTAGANGALSKSDIDKVVIKSDDILISQFETPIDTVEYFIRKGKSVGAKTILNAAPAKFCPDELLGLPDILLVNESELAFFLKEDMASLKTVQKITEATKQFARKTKNTVIVTIGDKGAIVVTADKVIHEKGHKVDAVDTTGAGDCFSGALAYKLANGASIEESAKFANAAAALSVQKMGAAPSMPTLSEVNSFLGK